MNDDLSLIFNLNVYTCRNGRPTKISNLFPCSGQKVWLSGFDLVDNSNMDIKLRSS